MKDRQKGTTVDRQKQTDRQDMETAFSLFYHFQLHEKIFNLAKSKTVNNFDKTYSTSISDG